MNKIILFWDTWFDLFNFKNSKSKVCTYLAKPRFSNALSELKKVKLKIFFTNPKLLLNLVNLIFLKKESIIIILEDMEEILIFVI